jgi:hypothetical protein
MRFFRSVHVDVLSVPNYMDISMTGKVVCDTILSLARSIYDQRMISLIKGWYSIH